MTSHARPQEHIRKLQTGKRILINKNVRPQGKSVMPHIRTYSQTRRLDSYQKRLTRSAGTYKDVIDDSMVRELKLYEENDHELYDQKTRLFRTMQKHMRKGVYDRELAIIGIRGSYIPFVVEKYSKQLGPIKPTAVDKDELARKIVDEFEEEVRTGETF